MSSINTNNRALFNGSLEIRIQNEIRGQESSSFQALLDAVDHPADLPLLNSVVSGSLKSFEAAIGLIDFPNNKGLEILGQLTSLSTATKAAYTAHSVVDVESSSKRRLVDFQGWKALAAAGNLDSSRTESPALAALGVNLGLAWLRKKEMAHAFCKNIQKNLYESNKGIEALFRRPAGDPICPWHSQFYKFWLEFHREFSAVPLPPETELDIDQATKSNLIGRAGFPSARRRAAILDSTCLSRDQIQAALRHDGRGVFRSAEEYQFALWLTGTSGAPVECAHKIHIWLDERCSDPNEDWTILIDGDAMLMKRDYSPLAKGAAAAKKSGSDESSFINSTYIPDRFFQVLRNGSRAKGRCTLGEVIPGLRQIKSEGVLYPTLCEFKPTWARWARSLGTLALQEGDDAFLAASLFGDFGLCAKSKVFYACVSASEAFNYQSKVYERLGWEAPTERSISALGFGSRVVPSLSELCTANTLILHRTEELRPPRRRSVESLVAFHNQVALAFAFRWMLRLSLRSAGSLPLYADILSSDLTVDIQEKSSQGRVGGMAAPLTREFHLELEAYRTHILALTNLPTVMSDLPDLVAWGHQVLNYRPVDLIRTICSKGKTHSPSSLQVLESLNLSQKFSPDFGRKWNENAARIAGFPTSAIDRLLRHEVKGQEATTSICEGSELHWSKSISTRLDQLWWSSFFGHINRLLFCRFTLESVG
jgi:hypothetical protein